MPKAEPGDYDLFMSACDDTGHLASDAEFDAWLASIDRGHYADEAPYEAEPGGPDLDESDIIWWAEELDRLASAAPCG